MRYALLATLGIVAAILVFARPANASITGAVLTTSQPSYVGPCPATIQFTGTITGTAGTVFTYSFNRFVNSVQQVVNGGTVTMPGGGSIAVNDSISISSSTSGSTFDQIWVHNISGGQPDVYSNKANFTVTCGAPPTPPPPPPTLPAPTSLTSTVDANLCATHIPLFCGAAISGGQLAFIWNWVNSYNASALDGYRLYRVDNGHHDLVGPTSAGASSTGTFLAAPSDGFNGKCYSVSAYKGAVESPLSNAFCVGGGTMTNPKTTTLSAGHVRGVLWNRYGRTGVFSSHTDESSACSNPPICVGFEHSTTINDLGDMYTNWYWRSGMWFDVASLSPKQIYKAVLHMHVSRTLQGDPNHWQQTSFSCIDALGMGNAQWWNGGALQGNFNYYIYFAQPGPNVAIDITTIAKEWLSKENDGVVIKGADENLSAFAKGSCITNFDGNPTLELTYL